jgi:hypothetical protein
VSAGAFPCCRCLRPSGREIAQREQEWTHPGLIESRIIHVLLTITVVSQDLHFPMMRDTGLGIAWLIGRLATPSQHEKMWEDLATSGHGASILR